MLLYPKFEKLSTQRGVAKLLIGMFCTIAFICFLLILYKYYLIDTSKIRDVVIANLEEWYNSKDWRDLNKRYKDTTTFPFNFNNNYFISLYIQCFSGFLIVVAWLSLIKEAQKIGSESNWGLTWLAFAILFWCFGDLINIAIEFHDGLAHKDKLPKFDETTKSIINKIVSTFNSFCFLYSLRYLEFNENSKWKKFRDSVEQYHSITLIVVLLVTLIAVTVALGLFTVEDSKLANIPDLIVSVLTTIALWVFFSEYFTQRNIQYMKTLVTVMVVVIVIVQVSQIFEQDFLDIFFIQEGAPILSMVYRPFLMMLFLLTAFGSLGNEKEKQAIYERRDMNHAIRGSLHLINKDIDRLVKKEKTNQNYENIFALQDFSYRVKSFYDLHNLIHNEYGDGKIGLKKYIQLLVENSKSAFEYTYLDLQFVNIDNIYVERNLLKKIGTVITELITNAAKAAIKKSMCNNTYPKFKLSDKLLVIKVENFDILLKISVGDNGIYDKGILTKASTGHGLNLVKRTILEDFEGKINLNQSQYEGTEISIEIPLSNLI